MLEVCAWLAKARRVRHLLGYNLGLTITKNICARRRKHLEGIHLLLSAVLLVKTDGDIDHDDCGEDAAFDPVLDDKTQDKGKEEDLVGEVLVSAFALRLRFCETSLVNRLNGESTYQNHGIHQLLDEDLVPRNSTAYVELILGILLLQLGDLGRGEASVQVCLGCLDDIFDREEIRQPWELGSHACRRVGMVWAQSLKRP